jgi:hypothetical protein
MARQTQHRADHSRNQKVYLPPHGMPSGFAENLGAGKPGRPSSNTIRTTIRARLYGTSVAPSDNSKGPKRHHQKGMPPGVTGQPRAVGTALDSDQTDARHTPAAASGRSRRKIVRKASY